MTTLIIGGMGIEDPNLLALAAKERGWKVVEVFGKYSFSDAFRSIKEPVIYAAPILAEQIARELEVKLVQVDEDWLPKLPYKFTKRKIEKRYYFNDFRDLIFPLFIKPAIYKVFPSKVYDSLEYFQKTIRLTHNAALYIQEPIHWEVEYRCFISNGIIQTCAPYRRNMETNKMETNTEEIVECHKLVYKLKQEDYLPITGALDLGKIKDRGWAVVELNGAYGSGVYNTDLQKVLDVLQETTYK